MITIRESEAMLFVSNCEQLDIEPPAPLVRALQQQSIIDAFIDQGPDLDRLLDKPADALRELIVDTSIRRHKGRADVINSGEETGLSVGARKISDALWRQAYAATAPELDRVTADLRPGFDATVAPIIRAARDHGITSDTEANTLIWNDTAKIEAFREAEFAIHDLEPYIELRIQMSELFKVSPTQSEQRDLRHLNRSGPRFLRPHTNYSVAFAAGENWSVDAFQLHEADGALDWYRMAIVGLRLNSPSEVASKIATRKTTARSEHTTPA